MSEASRGIASQRSGQEDGASREIREAIMLYKSQIENLSSIIASEPHNEEAIELIVQLKDALHEAREAYRSMGGSQHNPTQSISYATSASQAKAMDEDGHAADEEEGQDDEVISSQRCLHPVLMEDTRGARRSVGKEEDTAASSRSFQGPSERLQGRANGRTGNRRMHPDNLYFKEEPDFAALATLYPDEVGKYVTIGPEDGRAHYDFRSWEGTRQLTSTLLKHDLNIKWWCPRGHLIPTLTNRSNYIHFIADLLKLSSPEGLSQVKGLDVGCGTNTIYCLLGSGIYGWKMVGCDVTDVALEWSRKHKRINPHLSDLIEIRDSRRKFQRNGGGAMRESLLSDKTRIVSDGKKKIKIKASVPRVSSGGCKRPAVDALLSIKIEGQREREEGEEIVDVLSQNIEVRGGKRRDSQEQLPSSVPQLVDQIPSMSISEKGPVVSVNQNEADEPQSRPTHPHPHPASFVDPDAGDGGVEDGSDPDPWPYQGDDKDHLEEVEDEKCEEEEGEGEGEGEEGGVLISAMRGRNELFSFTMCNPPFFESFAEASSNPNTACGGTEVEVACPGGELAFIMSMVEDSVRLGGRVHWYSSMVGKKATLKALRKELHQRHVTAIRTTEFAQGKTSRWAVAWSFDVDPAIASLPLPRVVNPQLAPAPLPKRLCTFAIQSQHSSHQIHAHQDGRKLLQTMEAVLSCHGAVGIKVDHSTWVVTATLPLASDRQNQTANHRTAERTEEAAHVSVATDSKEDAAFTLGTSLGGGGRRRVVVEKGKRLRAGNGKPAVASVPSSIDPSPEGIAIRINIYSQQRDKYDVISSIGKQVDDAGALRFSTLMRKVEDDMNAMIS